MLMIYGYATRTHSSRRIERAICDSLAFRFTACKQHPDHDTVASFRRRFGEQFADLFVRVLRMAREPARALWHDQTDGNNLPANSFRHSALLYEHAEMIEAQWKFEVQEMLKLAEATDQSNVPEDVVCRRRSSDGKTGWRPLQRPRPRSRPPRGNVSSASRPTFARSPSFGSRWPSPTCREWGAHLTRHNTNVDALIRIILLNQLLAPESKSDALRWTAGYKPLRHLTCSIIRTI